MPAVTAGTEPRWLILGYDARESPEELGGAWTSERREAFLYRLDAENPLAVDVLVWPSAFERMPDWVPVYTGQVHGLWEDLAQLREAVRGVENCWLIAFAVDLASCTTQAEKVLAGYLCGGPPGGPPGPYPRPDELARPDVLDSSWEWLGCDVSDFLGISGLANCGLVRERMDVDALRREWGSRLNRHHLFGCVADARAFRAYADLWGSDHSPFFVMGIWRVG